jgi:cytidylate kinase
MSKKIIIAIDGFSSCGKSTLAKALATKLEYVFIDTGAMYRSIALYFLRNDISFKDTAAIENALGNIKLHFEYNAQNLKSDIFLNGENVATQIRAMHVSSKVSEVAAIEVVRSFAVAQQQAMGQQKGIVMDGRDIGTVVFPSAELKIFVTADPMIRANRRFLELQATDPSITLAAVAENLKHRDHIDSTREHSPLKQAADALVLDNSYMNKAEQFEMALKWAQERIALAQ